MTRDELLKEEFMSKKDAIKRAFSNKLTYNKWDKKLYVYAYNILTSEIAKVDDFKRIEFLLLLGITSHIVFFQNKEDVETYKWVHDTIENEIDNRIAEGFSDYANKFVDYKDLCSGCPAAHCGRCKPHTIFPRIAYPIVLCRKSPHVFSGLAAHCRSLV